MKKVIVGVASVLASALLMAGCNKQVIDLTLLDDSHEKAVREWLDYGILRGIGQWRNSGKGRFTYIAYEVKD